jgi:hypothetical protein
MGVVIEICIKYPGGRTRIRGTDIIVQPIMYVAPAPGMGDPQPRPYLVLMNLY